MGGVELENLRQSRNPPPPPPLPFELPDYCQLSLESIWFNFCKLFGLSNFWNIFSLTILLQICSSRRLLHFAACCLEDPSVTQQEPLRHCFHCKCFHWSWNWSTVKLFARLRTQKCCTTFYCNTPQYAFNCTAMVYPALHCGMPLLQW